MSEAVTPSILDFHSPRRPPTEAMRQLSAWQNHVCVHAQDGWASLFSRPVKLKPGRIEPVSYHSALQKLPEDGLGIYFSLGESLLPAMMIFSARQIQAFLADMLDLPGGKWPSPARATAVEDAMLELVFQKLSDAIGDGWPGDQRIACRFLETTHKPQRTRLFPVGSSLFALNMTVDSRFGEDPMVWLMLKEETEKLLLDHLGDSVPEDRSANPDLQATTERVPMDVVIELGKVELSMSQAAELEVGDVLILDQLMSHPLIASVASQAKWLGVPKRIGGRQAFEITQVIDNGNVRTLPTGPTIPSPTNSPTTPP